MADLSERGMIIPATAYTTTDAIASGTLTASPHAYGTKVIALATTAGTLALSEVLPDGTVVPVSGNLAVVANVALVTVLAAPVHRLRATFTPGAAPGNARVYAASWPFGG